MITTEVHDILTGRIARNRNWVDLPTPVLSYAVTPVAVIIPLPQSSYHPTVSIYRKQQNWISPYTWLQDAKVYLGPTERGNRK
jgi:hypothetical protein